jgi:hypothetical protein
MSKTLEKQIQEYLKQTQYHKTKKRILRQKEEALS